MRTAKEWWNELRTRHCQATNAVMYPLWGMVEHLYHGRPYHNLDHVARVLDYLAKRCNENEQLLPEVILAAIMHDAIYVAGATDNERRSADCAMVVCCAIEHEGMSYLVERYIMDTKHDKTPTTIFGFELCDADLAGLADPWDQFCATGKAIRKEFAHVSDDEFRAGRQKWMRDTLDRGRPLFYLNKALEAPARANMERWIKEPHDE